jgi:histidine triad (HIT) family protein
MEFKEYFAIAAFALARSIIGRFLIGWAFAHLSFALPVRRVLETSTLVAFHHPRPSYPLHILIVPKRAIPGLASLGIEHCSLLLDVFRMAEALSQKLDFEGMGAQLIVNGGAYQLIPQLHFHLVCDPLSVDTSRS